MGCNQLGKWGGEGDEEVREFKRWDKRRCEEEEKPMKMEKIK